MISRYEDYRAIHDRVLLMHDGVWGSLLHYGVDC